MDFLPDLVSRKIVEYKILYHFRNWRKKIANVHEEYFEKVTVCRPIPVCPYYGLFYNNIPIMLFLYPEQGRTYASIPRFLTGPLSQNTMIKRTRGSFSKNQLTKFDDQSIITLHFDYIKNYKDILNNV